jgi:hypothetical protein
MKSLIAWLADVFLGPRCPQPLCDHRARGWRTLADHHDLEHAGDPN